MPTTRISTSSFLPSGRCACVLFRQFIVNAVAVSKLSTYFLGKMRIHVAAFLDTEIIVGKDKVASVKRWLDS